MLALASPGSPRAAGTAATAGTSTLPTVTSPEGAWFTLCECSPRSSFCTPWKQQETTDWNSQTGSTQASASPIDTVWREPPEPPQPKPPPARAWRLPTSEPLPLGAVGTTLLRPAPEPLAAVAALPEPVAAPAIEPAVAGLLPPGLQGGWFMFVSQVESRLQRFTLWHLLVASPIEDIMKTSLQSWRSKKRPTTRDVSQAPAPEAREAQATCHPSALPEDSVPESRREATGPSVPEADAVDGPEAQREDSVDSPVGVLPADVLSGSPVSEVDHRPEENAFDGSGPDVPGVQSASVMSEVQAQVGDAADAPAESDVGHLEAAAPAAEPLGPAELDPSEAGSNSAWVSTAAPNPLASSEGDPEEDAAAAATSGDEDPEAGASTARVSTAAPFPSRMMTDIASSESELQEVASSVASEAEQLEVRPSQMTSEDVSNQQATSSTWQADHQWPATVELAPSPVAASAAWPAFESQDAQRDTRGAASKPQVTWQSPGTDMERLAASVEKLTEEMRAKWSLLDDLTHRLSQVEQSLRVSSNAKVEELEERVDQLERQLKAMESQNGLNGELAEVDHNEAPSHRGQHQVWL
ncbi:unnamed protein product [Cladocopium goreaui]|uniref:Uncharacterized protein n=1 Tax=Cladocopium goreaui TaxID=2562237 RepID=A0A9P1C7Y0_9DINO|nr:unnamed protein product [Cladocopium goreaui]